MRNESATWRLVQGLFASMYRGRKSNSGGGKTRNSWKVRDHAVIAEVVRLVQEGTFFGEESVEQVSALATVAEAAVASTSVHVVDTAGVGSSVVAQEIMPASYADDIRHIHRNFDPEEVGVRKPNANERLAVARLPA